MRLHYLCLADDCLEHALVYVGFATYGLYSMVLLGTPRVLNNLPQLLPGGFALFQTMYRTTNAPRNLNDLLLFPVTMVGVENPAASVQPSRLSFFCSPAFKLRDHHCHRAIERPGGAYYRVQLVICRLSPENPSPNPAGDLEVVLNAFTFSPSPSSDLEINAASQPIVT